MRYLIRIAEAVLYLAIVGLVAALALPWGESLPLFGDENQVRSAQPTPLMERPLPARADPSVILILLAGPSVTPPPPPAAAAAEPPAPVEKIPAEATWLKYIGRSMTTEGRLSFHIKDTRSGRMMRVVQGETIDGVSLVEVAEGRIVLGSGDDLLVVTVR